ncbi:hypothetical protein Y032_0002g848 [Ancylostoma ceylanicum]|uniref:Uncharacterized protein n=1 Tax=Ancylostoma ceylanicum TaxID=53326 RepID=A0A016W2R1_9BILA|nr:hypothetical protein Y032_0002g848 [Ancylostoma ceylanicum]
MDTIFVFGTSNNPSRQSFDEKVFLKILGPLMWNSAVMCFLSILQIAPQLRVEDFGWCCLQPDFVRNYDHTCFQRWENATEFFLKDMDAACQNGRNDIKFTSKHNEVGLQIKRT